MDTKIKIIDSSEIAAEPQEQFDVLTDDAYIRKTKPVIISALDNGCDVIQMPNGDLIVTETKTITTQYKWNQDKNKMEPKAAKEKAEEEEAVAA